MLTYIFDHLPVDGDTAIKNIYEQYPETNLSFIINKDANLVLEDEGREGANMFEWNLLQVAIAFKANRTAKFLTRNPHLCIMPRADLSVPDLEPDQPPHLVDGVDYLLELEIRPLLACIIAKDYAMLLKLWRRLSAWESCHFYRLLEILFDRKDKLGLTKLLTPQNHFVNNFCEPAVLQAILSEYPETPAPMVSKI